MSVARLWLALVGETMFPPRAPFFSAHRASSRLASRANESPSGRDAWWHRHGAGKPTKLQTATCGMPREVG
jgi:hypothetical protein